MTISAMNYAAQAQRALLGHVSDLHASGSSDAARLALVLSLMKEAQHFALPDNAELFEDGLRGLAGQRIRLPFPQITLEYFIPPSATLLAEAPVYVSRVVIVAAEVPAEALGLAGVDGARVAIFSMYQENGQWLPNIGAFVLDERWDDYAGYSASDGLVPAKAGMPPAVGAVLPWMKEVARELADAIGVERAQKELAHNIAAEVYAVLSFCEAMSCSNVGTGVLGGASAAVNARRVRDGKLPLLETKVLTVHVPGKQAARIDAGSKTGHVRQHLRRGHIRRVSEDRRVWVNSCVVGNAENGRVEKDYRVQPEVRAA